MLHTSHFRALLAAALLLAANAVGAVSNKPINSLSVAAEGEGTESDPYSVAEAIANQTGDTAWVKGYIVGANSGAPNYTLETVAPFTLASNVYIADDPSETDTDKMLPLQLVSGTEIRSAVNLKDNPGNFNKLLYAEGVLTQYFGQPGLKEATNYRLEGDDYEFYYEPTSSSVNCQKVTSITDGTYILWAENKIGVAFTDGYSYGYMYSAGCPLLSDGTIQADKDNLYTFTEHSQGWTIADSHGQYLYTDELHNSFNLTKSPDTSDVYIYWTITADADGQFTITNIGSGRIIQYDPNYDNFAVYSTVTGTLPYIYQPIDYQPIDGADEDDEDDGDNTEIKPYTVAEAIALNNPGTAAWVMGYIVGARNYTNNNYEFETTPPFGIAANICIADNPDETDVTKVMHVQLLSGTDVRSSLNLIDNPSNLGHSIALYGSLTAYFAQPGLKETSDYILDYEIPDPNLEQDGVNEVETISGEKAAEVYDLQGRRLAAPHRGINIVNGRKIIVR